MDVDSARSNEERLQSSHHRQHEYSVLGDVCLCSIGKAFILTLLTDITLKSALRACLGHVEFLVAKTIIRLNKNNSTMNEQLLLSNPHLYDCILSRLKHS